MVDCAKNDVVCLDMQVELVQCTKDFVGFGMGVLMTVSQLPLGVIMMEKEGMP